MSYVLDGTSRAGQGWSPQSILSRNSCLHRVKRVKKVKKVKLQKASGAREWPQAWLAPGLQDLWSGCVSGFLDLSGFFIVNFFSFFNFFNFFNYFLRGWPWGVSPAGS